MSLPFRPLERARELGRLGEIAATFAKHGLGDLLQRLGLAGPLERAGAALRVRSEPGWAGPFAQRMLQVPSATALLQTCDLVVPVPLTR